MPVEDVLGVVLAGGASRRMGFDKRKFEFEGRSLVRRAADALLPVCAEVVLSTQPDSRFEEPSLRAIPDLRPESGPLAALEAALGEGAGRPVFVLACDLPHVTADVVRHILGAAARARESRAVVPSLAGRVQPLCAVYRAEALAAVRSQLDAGKRAMRDLLAVLSVEEVEVGPELPFHRADLFHNLNRPSDLEALSKVLAS